MIIIFSLDEINFMFKNAMLIASEEELHNIKDPL